VVGHVVASIVLALFLRQIGIALATSLAAWVNAILLGITLRRRGLFSLDERSRKRLPRIVMSAVLMGVILAAGTWLLRDNYAEKAGFTAAAWGLLLLVTGGIGSYFAIAQLTGAMRLGELKSMLKR
jgi:putative peptidoglycan lipid II flippase